MAFAVLLALIGAAADAQTPAAPAVSEIAGPLFPLDRTHPRQLSGLTWAGGDRFYAVSDSETAIHAYRITIDPEDGRILGITLERSVPLRDAQGGAWRGGDLEGIAFDEASGDVWIGDEGRSSDLGQAVRRHRVSDGRLTGRVEANAPSFRPRNGRANAGLEALSMAGRFIWTANEDALAGDGPASDIRRGGLVRLTRIESGRPVSQWVYPLEPSGGSLPTGGRPMSGVVDLVALDESRVLVLERATAGSRGPADIGGFISRLFLVDVRGATDVANIADLEGLQAGRDFELLRKRLLWSRYFSLFGGPNNFEGLALGPALADGSRSLLLIADNDALPSNLLALRLHEQPSDGREP